MLVKSHGLLCMLVEYVKDNYYAKFHDPSHIGTKKDTLVFYAKRHSDKVNGA